MSHPGLMFSVLLLVLISCGDSHNTQVVQTNDKQKETDSDELPEVATSLFSALRTNFIPTATLPPIIAPTIRGLPVAGLEIPKDDPSYVIARTEYLKQKEQNHLVFEKGLRRVVIQGLVVNLDGNPRNPLHKALSENRDIKELEIHAQHVILSGHYKLPSTQITINTKSLTLEGNGMLDITPEGYLSDAEQFQDGKPGLDAPDFVIHADKLEISNPLKNYFRSKGGAGQNAGRGRDGLKGQSLPNTQENEILLICTLANIAVSGDGAILSISRIQNKNIRGLNLMDTSKCAQVTGRNERPGNGENAIPGGKPGLPGKSGSLKASNPELLSLVDLSLGAIGSNAPTAIGGEAGQPNIVRYQIIENFINRTSRETGIFNQNTHSVESEDGADAVGPVVTIQTNQFTGSAALIDEDKLKTQANDSLPLLFRYINDLYRKHHYGKVYHLGLEMLGNLTRLKEEGLQNQHTLKYELDLMAMIDNLEANKNIYGLDAYGVPTISAANSALVFNRQVKHSLEALTLIRMVKYYQNEAQAQLMALTETKNHLSDAIALERENYTNSISSISQLENEAQQMQQDVLDYMSYVRNLENEIAAQAKAEIERREAKLAREQKRKARSFTSILGSLGSIAMVIPGAQPLGMAMNAAGTLISTFEEDSWEQRIQKASQLYRAASDVSLSSMSNEWNEKYEPIRSRDFGNLSTREKAKYIEDLYKFSRPTIDALTTEAKKFRTQTVPQSNYEEVVAQIRDLHPEFNTAIRKLEILNGKREILNQKLDQALAKILEQQNSILNQSTILANLNVKPEVAMASLTSLEMSALDDMEQMSQNRLDQAYNYFTRAYYFRTLFNLRSSFDFLRFIDRVNVLIANHQGQLVDVYPKVESLYRQELNNALVHLTSSNLVNETKSSAHIDLQGPMLKKLSQGTPIYLNLDSYGVFGSHIKNPRIQTITIEEVEFDVHSDEIRRYVDLTLEHSGVSQFENNGEQYVFTHNDHAHTWGKRLDLSPARYHSPIQRSEGFENLFSALLEDVTVSENLLYPSAKGDLKLELQGLEGRDDLLEIQSIRVKVDFIQGQ